MPAPISFPDEEHLLIAISNMVQTQTIIYMLDGKL